MAETAVEIKLFGKWTYDDVEVTDVALKDYLTVTTKKIYLPHSAGCFNVKRFRKA